MHPWRNTTRHGPQTKWLIKDSKAHIALAEGDSITQRKLPFWGHFSMDVLPYIYMNILYTWLKHSICPSSFYFFDVIYWLKTTFTICVLHSAFVVIKTPDGQPISSQYLTLWQKKWWFENKTASYRKCLQCICIWKL
jgi:hypothetical protein